MHLGSQIPLIASNDVRSHMVNVNNTIKLMSENLATISEHQDDYNKHIKNLINAARKELGAKT